MVIASYFFPLVDDSVRSEHGLRTSRSPPGPPLRTRKSSARGVSCWVPLTDGLEPGPTFPFSETPQQRNEFTPVFIFLHSHHFSRSREEMVVAIFSPQNWEYFHARLVFRPAPCEGSLSVRCGLSRESIIALSSLPPPPLPFLRP